MNFKMVSENLSSYRINHSKDEMVIFKRLAVIHRLPKFCEMHEQGWENFKMADL